MVKVIGSAASLALSIGLVAGAAEAQTSTSGDEVASVEASGREALDAVAGGADVPYEHEALRSVALHASTIRQGELVLGVWRFEVGLFDFLSVGTSLPYWIAGIPFGTTFPSVYLRAGIPLGDLFTLGARAGFVYANIGRVYASLSGDEESTVASKVFITPLALIASFHTERIALSVEAIYTTISGDGTSLLDEESLIGGVAFTNTLQMQFVTSVRIVPQLALTVQARYLPYHGPLLTSVDVAAGKGRVAGELEINAAGLQHSWAALAGVHLTFGAFNVRLAAGWGALFLRDLGLVIPTESLQLDFDLYFRF